VYTVVVHYNSASAVLVAGVDGKNTAVILAIICSEIVRNVNAGLPFGTVTAKKSGRLVTLENLLRGHRTYLGRCRSDKLGYVVEVVGRLLKEKTARFAVVTVPLVIVPYSVRHVAPTLNVCNLTDFALRYQLLYLKIVICKAKRKGHRYVTAGIGAIVNHPFEKL
jgi:hypothetical protein